jgi:peptidyl-prolyl cis-trans isomerase C
MANAYGARRFRRGVLTTAILTVVCAAGVGTGPGAAQDKPVATVNGRAITESEITLAEAEIGSDLGSLPLATRRRVLVEFLIETQLMAEAAAKATSGRGETFDQGADQRLQYWHRKALRDRFFDTQIKSSVRAIDARRAFQAQAGQSSGEALRARHILLDTEEQAKSVHEEIVHGADFAVMARKYSKDAASRDVGGALGTFTRGQMVPQFEDAAFQLSRGEMSQPVRSQFGWHIIRVDERVQKERPSFESVRRQITAALIHRKAQDVLNGLRSRAKIEYHDPEIKRQVEMERRQGPSRQ